MFCIRMKGSFVEHLLAFIYILHYSWLLCIIMQKVPWGLILLLIAAINLIHLRLRQKMPLSMMTSNNHEHEIQTCSVITWSDCGSENVKSTHPVGQLWNTTIKFHMLYAAMCATTSSTAGK